MLLIYTFAVFVRPFDTNPAFIPYRPMLVLGVLCLLCTAGYLPLSRLSFKARQAPLVLIFTLVLILSRIIALRWVGGALEAMDEFMIVPIYFFAVIVTVNSLPKLRWLLFAIATACFIVALQATYAYYYGSGEFRELYVLQQRMEQVSEEEWSFLERVRGMGFFADPNDLAQGILMAIPLMFIAWKSRSPFRNVALFLVPSSFMLWCVYLTHSRGAALALIVMAVFWLRRRVGGMLAGLMTGGTVLGLVAINIAGGRLTKDESIIDRFEAWSVGLELLKSHPFFGVGYRFFTDFNPITAHNSYVLCFAELGFVGFVVWMAIILLTVWELNQLVNLAPIDELNEQLSRYAEMVRLSLIAFLTAAWFLSRTYTLPLYLLIGLGVVLAEIARRENRMPVEPSLPVVGGRTVALCLAIVAGVYLTVRVAVR